MNRLRISMRLVTAVSLSFVAVWGGEKPTPPAQPKSGPGGADYTHRAVVSKECGKGGTAYWLFEPGNPKPDRAPLIVFNHGWAVMQPRPYDAWIEHIVKRGNIVVYPRYQEGLLTPPAEFTPNASTAIKAAIERLKSEAGHVKPDLDKFAIVGHSMGGCVSANLTANWESAGLPRPKAVMPIQPGKTWGPVDWALVKLEDLSRVAPETLLLCVVGDRDQMVQDVDAKRIFKETTRVPAANKSFVTLVTDEHGEPALVADHFAPCAATTGTGGQQSDFAAKIARRADALDYFGTWKLFDALTDAAFYGKNRKYALGNTPEQRFMGKWSDGVPVKELKVTTAP